MSYLNRIEPHRRRGLTLIELMLAIAVMGIMMGVLGGLASAVQMSTTYGENYGFATQNARIAFERINRAAEIAYSAGDVEGIVVSKATVSGADFPDTLIVWRPTSSPANVPPLVRDLVFFCPNPDNPSELLEFTAPTNGTPVPTSIDWNSTAVRDAIQTLARANDSKKVVLTNRLRTFTMGGLTMAAVRFSVIASPSSTQIAAYRGGTLAWNDISWPMGVFQATSGMRQMNLKTEIQLIPSGAPSASDQLLSLTFFSSATCNYSVLP